MQKEEEGVCNTPLRANIFEYKIDFAVQETFSTVRETLSTVQETLHTVQERCDMPIAVLPCFSFPRFSMDLWISAAKVWNDSSLSTLFSQYPVWHGVSPRNHKHLHINYKGETVLFFAWFCTVFDSK